MSLTLCVCVKLIFAFQYCCVFLSLTKKNNFEKSVIRGSYFHVNSEDCLLYCKSLRVLALKPATMETVGLKIFFTNADRFVPNFLSGCLLSFIPYCLLHT